MSIDESAPSLEIPPAVISPPVPDFTHVVRAIEEREIAEILAGHAGALVKLPKGVDPLPLTPAVLVAFYIAKHHRSIVDALELGGDVFPPELFARDIVDSVFPPHSTSFSRNVTEGFYSMLTQALHGIGQLPADQIGEGLSGILWELLLTNQHSLSDFRELFKSNQLPEGLRLELGGKITEKLKDFRVQSSRHAYEIGRKKERIILSFFFALVCVTGTLKQLDKEPQDIPVAAILSITTFVILGIMPIYALHQREKLAELASTYSQKGIDDAQSSPQSAVHHYAIAKFLLDVAQNGVTLKMVTDVLRSFEESLKAKEKEGNP